MSIKIDDLDEFRAYKSIIVTLRSNPNALMSIDGELLSVTQDENILKIVTNKSLAIFDINDVTSIRCEQIFIIGLCLGRGIYH